MPLEWSKVSSVIGLARLEEMLLGADDEFVALVERWPWLALGRGGTHSRCAALTNSNFPLSGAERHSRLPSGSFSDVGFR